MCPYVPYVVKKNLKSALRYNFAHTSQNHSATIEI